MNEVSQFTDNTKQFADPALDSETPVNSVCAIGFSCRALVEAIRSAGLPALAVDHFGDYDLRQRCQQAPHVVAWEFDPQEGESACSQAFEREIEAALSSLPASTCCVLAGGAENLGALFSHVFGGSRGNTMQTQRRILGPTAEQMQLLRDPRNLAIWCTDLEVCFPRTLRVAAKVEEFGENVVPTGNVSWLHKSPYSGGGIGIREADTPLLLQPKMGVYQQRVAGIVIGVTFCLTPDQPPELLGVTRALTPEEWPGPLPYIYRGTLGPLAISAELRDQLLRLARRLQSETGLVGWLPMDLIVDKDGRLWLLEINPRWTAGMEVLLRSGVNPLPFHLSAFGVRTGNHGLERPLPSDPSTAFTAKAIVYADRDYELRQDHLEALQALWHRVPERYADIPSTEQMDPKSGRLAIPRGQPICTVLADLPSDASGAVPIGLGADRDRHFPDSETSKSETRILGDLVRELNRTRNKALSLLEWTTPC